MFILAAKLFLLFIVLNFISRSGFNVIVRVSVVLYKTVVDSDCGLDNLCSSQEFYHVS